MKLEILCRLLHACAKQFILVPSPEMEPLSSPKTIRTKYLWSLSMPTSPQTTTMKTTLMSQGRISPTPSTAMRYLIDPISRSLSAWMPSLVVSEVNCSLFCFDCRIFRFRVDEQMASRMDSSRNKQQEMAMGAEQAGSWLISSEEKIRNCRIFVKLLMVDAGIFCSLQQSSSTAATNLPSMSMRSRSAMPTSLKLTALYILTPKIMPQKSSSTYRQLVTNLQPPKRRTHSRTNPLISYQNFLLICSLKYPLIQGWRIRAPMHSRLSRRFTKKYFLQATISYFSSDNFEVGADPRLIITPVCLWKLGDSHS